MSPGAEADKPASIRKPRKGSHDKHPGVRKKTGSGVLSYSVFLLYRCVLFLFFLVVVLFLFFLFVSSLHLAFSLPAPSGGRPSASAFPLFPLMNDEQDDTEDNQEQENEKYNKDRDG